VTAIGRDQCDLEQPLSLPNIIRRINPDVTINAATYTAVDNAELEEQRGFIVNGKSVGLLAYEPRPADAEQFSFTIRQTTCSMALRSHPRDFVGRSPLLDHHAGPFEGGSIRAGRVPLIG
jgi:hypothetical protein